MKYSDDDVKWAFDSAGDPDPVKQKLIAQWVKEEYGIELREDNWGRVRKFLKQTRRLQVAVKDFKESDKLENFKV